jgi:hypothetical protein
MADLSYQNVVHKRMGGQMFVIPTGCTGVVESGGVFNVESGGKIAMDSGGALAINGTDYIDTGGRIVDQYESKTTADASAALAAYGVSYVTGSTAAANANYYLPTGVANVEKTIITDGLATGAVIVTCTGCQIGYSTALAYTTLTASTYNGGVVKLIAKTSTQWLATFKSSEFVIS